MSGLPDCFILRHKYVLPLVRELLPVVAQESLSGIPAGKGLEEERAAGVELGHGLGIIETALDQDLIRSDLRKGFR